MSSTTPLALVTPWFSREAWALARARRAGGGWPARHLARMAALDAAAGQALAAGRPVEILATTALPADAPWPGPVCEAPAALFPDGRREEDFLRDVPPQGNEAPPAGETPAAERWVRDAFPEDVIPLAPGLTLRRFAPAAGSDEVCARLAALAARQPLSAAEQDTLCLESLHSPRLYGYLRSRPALAVACLPEAIPLARFALAAHARAAGRG